MNLAGAADQSERRSRQTCSGVNDEPGYEPVDIMLRVRFGAFLVATATAATGAKLSTVPAHGKVCILEADSR